MANPAIHIIEKQLSGERITAFDVGAKGGIFSFPKLEKYCTFYGFEPNPDEYKKLLQSNQDASISYFPFALSDKKGVANLRITKYPSYSSFLEFDAANFDKHFGRMKGSEVWRKGLETDKVIPVETESIDNLMQRENLPLIHFLKLDTQGTELQILQGAKETLEATQIGVIFTEFSFIQSYVGQNLFSELELYLRDLNYELIDCRFYPGSVQKIFWPFGKIYDQPRYSTGGDAVFVPAKMELLDARTAFKIGLITTSLRYYGIASRFFRHSQMNDTEIELVFRYFRRFKWRSNK